jgi:hypothetical protein
MSRSNQELNPKARHHDSKTFFFEGPEAYYIRNAFMTENYVQPFRHCKTVQDFLEKVETIAKTQTMGLGLPKNRLDWYLYRASEELFPHSEFIPWRMTEEQNMSLFCLGKTTLCENKLSYDRFVPVLKTAKLNLGIFAHDRSLAMKLRRKWRGTSYNRSLTSCSEIFSDIMCVGSESGISTFAYIRKDFPLLEISQKYTTLLLCGSGNNLKAPERKSIEKIAWLFDEKRFRKDENFLTNSYELKRGSKIILACTDLGGISVEILSPGSWSSSRCYDLGHVDDFISSKALLNLLFGDISLDAKCKQKVGSQSLYLSNDCQFAQSRLEACIPFRDANDWLNPKAPHYPLPKPVKVRLHPNVFYLSSKQTKPGGQRTSLRYLAALKYENRCRGINLIKDETIETKKKILNDKIVSSTLTFAIKIKRNKRLKTSAPMRKYPLEFAVFQSPYMHYSEPTETSRRYRYDGYEARITPSHLTELYGCKKRPTALSHEEEVTCLDIPNRVILETYDKSTLCQMTMTAAHVSERVKKDPYYQGIVNYAGVKKVGLRMLPFDHVSSPT